MILDGRVTVNGRVLTNPEVRVHPEREPISVDGIPAARRARIYIMMHKPAGIVTTRSDERGRSTVYDLLGNRNRWIFPVGRLDRESRGLLLFTNDTKWANALTSPDSKVVKLYEVRLDRPMDPEEMSRFRSGMTLDDGYRTRPAEIRNLRRADGPWVEVKITEGRNRQVRRMIQALGYTVQELVRTRIGSVSMDDLPEGTVRPLTRHEVRVLTAM